MKNIYKKVQKFTAAVLGKFLSIFFPYRLYVRIEYIYRLTYTAWIKSEYKTIGSNCIIGPSINLLNGKYIILGDNVILGKNLVLNAWDKFEGNSFHPVIEIGCNSRIGDDSHITAINKIFIGKNVLTGKKLTITDNSHGLFDIESLQVEPIRRKLYSKGPVVIEDNVWIGEKVTILPGVTIGYGSIIGANSVVSMDIPKYSLAVGAPAKIIKYIDYKDRKFNNGV